MSRRMMGYEIVTDAYYGRLEDAVNDKIALGFEPLGAMIKGDVKFFQTMVKYEDPEPRVDVSPKVFAPNSEGE